MSNDEWDSVSNDTPPNSANDPSDAVSTPPRRRAALPDNLVIPDLSQPDSSSDQPISQVPPFPESQTQQDDIAIPPDLPNQAALGITHISRKPLSAPSLKRTVLFVLIGFLLGMSGLSTFYVVSTSTAHSAALAAANAKATAIAKANATAAAQVAATATMQAFATATALQQIYTQATNGTPTLDDPLSDDSNNWPTSNTDGGGTCAFTGGAYHLGLAQVGYWIWCVCAAPSNLNNFALQVQMSIDQGNEGGVIFGGTDNHSYRVYINSSGTYILYVQNNGQDQTLQSGSSPAIKTGLNQTNVITIIVNNSNFYLFVNQQFVTSYSLNVYNQGSVGFTADSVDQATDVAFSNAKIWTL